MFMTCWRKTTDFQSLRFWVSSFFCFIFMFGSFELCFSGSWVETQLKNRYLVSTDAKIVLHIMTRTEEGNG